MHTLRRLLNLIPEQHSAIVWVVILNTLLGLVALVPPYALKLAVDSLVKLANNGNQSAWALLATPLILLATARLFVALFEYIRERLSDVMRLDSIIRLRARMFEHVLDLSIDYYETHRVGETIQRITDGVYEFASWLQMVAEDMLLKFLTVIFGIGVIAYIDPVVGVVVFIMAVLRLGLALRKKQVTRPERTAFREYWGQVLGQITETIQNMTTVRSFGGEKNAYNTHVELNKGLRGARYRQHSIEWKYNFWLRFIEGLGIIGAVGTVSLSVIGGQASVGDVLLIFLYLQLVIGSLDNMAYFIDMTGELISTSERVLELLDVEPTVVDRDGAKTVQRLDSIEFKNVSFSYPGHSQLVLKDVSFILDPGKMLALVGPSGTGKSTIVKLLLRLYEPTHGQILVNGKDIAEFTGASLRKHIGTVMQDVALFNDSFADNVRMANPNASQKEVDTAVKLAHAKEFVDKLPDGYDTIVGERGIKLSGGQKQRVAIARAILKQPDLVILDEATSALDSTSEQQVQQGLNQLLAGRMSVIIAHRLSTVKHADEILVIEKGQITERGSHDELIKHKGTYHHLFELQSQRL